MNGKRGKAFIPLMMAAAIAAQFWAVSFSAGPASRQDALSPLVKTAPAVLASNSPDDPAYVLQQLDEEALFQGSSAPRQTQSLQGAITSIRVVRGRSQIVKFAQPVAQVSIADPTFAAIIALAPDQIMINGLERGVTSLIVWDENGQEGIFDLYVQNDTSEILDAVASVAPNEKIDVRITNDSFILTGQVSNSVILDEIRQVAAAYGYPDDASPSKDKFKDLTDTPIPQVALEVRIAEVNRSTTKIMDSGISYTKLPGKFANSVISRGATPTTSEGIVGVLSRVTNNSDFGLNLDFRENAGKINILANPTLVCTHGREAEFLAGGEFPFRSGTDQSGQPIVSFKEFGVKLKFTPWISIRSGRVELRVEPEVSSRDTSTCIEGAGGDLVCGILTRRTSTTVELNDGETLLISGILQREEQNSFAQTPFIGSVPILGALFKNGEMAKSNKELVVIITPRIVNKSDYGKYLGSAQ